MKLKKILIGVMSISMLTLCGGITQLTYASGVETDDVSNLSLRYKHIKYAKSDLQIKNGNAIIKSSMTSSISTTKNLITSRLQKKVNGKWTTVEAWTASTVKNNCSLSKTKSISKGYEYRVFSTVKAYTSNDSESIAVYSPIKKY